MSDEDENTTGDQTDDAGTDRADDAEGADSLGDAGKKALDAMKGKWQKERDERKVRDARIAELEAKLAAKGDDGDKNADAAARRDLEAKALAKANDRIVRSEVKAAAVGKLADPKDALLLLDLASFEVDGDGGVDEEEIADAIDKLLKEKPYLAAQGGRRFGGSADQGSRKGSSRPAQLTQADLDRMTPEQIVAAKKNGQFDDLMSGKR